MASGVTPGGPAQPMMVARPTGPAVVAGPSVPMVVPDPEAEAELAIG
jgi:hypothetical protein